jgi:hypothetical protein
LTEDSNSSTMPRKTLQCKIYWKPIRRLSSHTTWRDGRPQKSGGWDDLKRCNVDAKFRGYRSPGSIAERVNTRVMFWLRVEGSEAGWTHAWFVRAENNVLLLNWTNSGFCSKDRTIKWCSAIRITNSANKETVIRPCSVCA